MSARNDDNVISLSSGEVSRAPEIDLLFPFQIKKSKLESAGSHLTDASGTKASSSVQKLDSLLLKSKTSGDTRTKVIIYQVDRENLKNPRQWLNDAYVDLWMLW